MTGRDDALSRASIMAMSSYDQMRQRMTPTQIDAQLQHAQALALVEIAYSLRRIEGLLRR